jgi:predicted transcriptional regulator
LENKKNEVDELAENVAILYTKEISHLDSANKFVYERIDGETVTSIIQSVAESTSKTFPSLTKKTIFKFMDLVDM